MAHHLPELAAQHPALQQRGLLEPQAEGSLPAERNPSPMQFLNLWDKSYYGYNRKEQEERDRKWREEVFNTINQEALPGK
jgi:hypothetical protein